MNKQVETFLIGSPKSSQGSPQDETVSFGLVLDNMETGVSSTMPVLLLGLLARLSPFLT